MLPIEWPRQSTFLFAFYCMNAAHKQLSMEVHRHVTYPPKVSILRGGAVLFNPVAVSNVPRNAVLPAINERRSGSVPQNKREKCQSCRTNSRLSRKNGS